MGRRAAGWSCLVVIAVVGIAYLVKPAPANQLDFLCSVATPTGGGGGGGGTTTTTAPTIADAGVGVFNGIDIIFTGHAPPGVKVHGVAPDPVTGWTNFTRIIPARFGWIGVDFLDPTEVPGTAGDEVGFRFQPRLATKNTDNSFPTRLTELFNQNFGIPFDFGPLAKPKDNILIAGLDVDFTATRPIKDMVGGFKAETAIGIRFKRADNSRTYTRVAVALDSTPAGYEWPKHTMLGIAFKHDNPSVPVDYWAVHQNVEDYDLDADTQVQKGMGIGVNVDTLEVNASGVVTSSAPMLTAKTTWNHAPHSFAAGIRSICQPWDPTFRTTGHMAWNLSGLADPANTTLGIELHSGIAKGLPITILDGGLLKTVRSDETVIDGTVSKVPQRMDYIMHQDSFGITRSREVAPTIDLRRFELSSDDPTTTNDLPIHAEGRLVDLPRHVLMTAGFGPDGGLNRADISLWNLSCPGEPAPPGPVAPPDVARNDITDTLPLFPAGCTRFSLQPVTSATALVQNFLPQDLTAQAATSGLAAPPTAANQFLYYVSRDHNPMSNDSLYRMGGGLNGLTRAVYDASSPPPGGDGLRVYGERVEPSGGGDDSLRAVVDFDSRTNLTDESANAGSRVQADVTIPDFPRAIRVDYETTPTTPVHVTYRATSPISLANGTIDAQLAGPTALRAHARLETGAVGSGPLPPAGELQLSEETATAVSVDTTNTVRWKAPGLVADVFPTPTVPSYDPQNVTRIHAGAEISTAAERATGNRTRVHADVDVPQDVTVSWKQSQALLDPSSRHLALVEASLCATASPACGNTRLDATGVYGAPGGPAELLLPPPLPDVPPDVAASVPAFTPFRPGSGVRALILPNGIWGVDGLVRGVARFRYAPDPQDVTVVLGGTGAQPFRANLLDASGTTADTGGTQRRQVLFADAALDRLPQQMRAIIRDDGAYGAADPWVWVNTDDVALDHISGADLSTTDPPGTRPTLAGTLRIGDLEYLSATDKLAVSKRPFAARATRGADVWGYLTPDSGRLAFDAVVSVDVARHVAVWEPATTPCRVESPDAATCQPNQLYEMNESDTTRLAAKTTSGEIGDLRANVHLLTAQIDYIVKAAVGHVPGRIDGGVKISKNRRLPFTGIDLDFDANTGLGTVVADVFDMKSPASYRQADTTTGTCDANAQDFPCTATYGAELANVPAKLALHANIFQMEPRLLETPSDPGGVTSEAGGIGYLHAAIDLHDGAGLGAGAVDEVSVNALVSGSGQIAATVDASAPISGFVNGRMDHIKLGGDQNQSFSFLDVYARVLNGLPNWSYYTVVIPVLAVVLGPIFAAIYSGDLTFEPTEDFDLPLNIAFDNVTNMRIGVHGNTISLDERHAGGTGTPMTFSIEQKSQPHEPSLDVMGAFFHHRDVKYSFDGIAESFDEHVTNTNEFGVVGLYNWKTCFENGDDNGDTIDEEPCNVSPRSRDNSVSITDFPSDKRPGWDSADVLFDPLFDPGARSDIEDENDGLVEPGDIYGQMADKARPLDDADFAMPDVTPTGGAPKPQVDAFTVALGRSEVTVGGGGGGGGGVTFVYQSASCGEPRGFSDDPSVGNDGTAYRVKPYCQPLTVGFPGSEQPKQLVLGFSLEALFGEKVSRWEVNLPDPAGFDPSGDDSCETELGSQHQTGEILGIPIYGTVNGVTCDVSFEISPQQDGSVQVSATVVRHEDADFDGTPEDTTLATTRAWVDASGHLGAFQTLDPVGVHPRAASAVDDFTAAAVTIGTDANATLDPAGIGTFPCVTVPVIGEVCWSAQYLYGDGSMSPKTTIGGPPLPPSVHRYPLSTGTDRFLAIYVVYDPAGNVVAKKYFQLYG